MTERIGFMVRAAAMVLAALVLAHTLVFLAQYGATFSDRMSRTGHDHGWIVAALAALALGSALLGAATWRLRCLRRTAQAAGAHRLPGEPSGWAFLRRWLAWWVALTVVTAFLFVIEENLELKGVGARLPGIGVLFSATYPATLAILAAVTLGVSLIAALLGWKLDLWIARIQAARPDGRFQEVRFGAFEPIDRRRGSILGRRLAGRAPPAASAF